MTTITEVMICWTGRHDFEKSDPTYGRAALVAWPDKAGASDIYTSTSGACDSKVHKWNDIERRHFVMSTALGMIISDKMDPGEVHRALWPLGEYRRGLPPDTPCPPGDTRFGKYAAASEDQE